MILSSYPFVESVASLVVSSSSPANGDFQHTAALIPCIVELVSSWNEVLMGLNGCLACNTGRSKKMVPQPWIEQGIFALFCACLQYECDALPLGH